MSRKEWWWRWLRARLHDLVGARLAGFEWYRRWWGGRWYQFQIGTRRPVWTILYPVFTFQKVLKTMDYTKPGQPT